MSLAKALTWSRSFLAQVKLEFKSGFMYQADLLSSLTWDVAAVMLYAFLWHALTGPQGQLMGYDLNALVGYYTVAQAMGNLMLVDAGTVLAREVRSGAVAAVLTKPIPPPILYLGGQAGRNLSNVIVKGIPLVLIMSLALGIDLDLSYVPLAALTAALGFTVSFLFEFLVGSLSLGLKNQWGTRIFTTALVALLGGGLVPIDFYPPVLRQIALATPFPFIYYLPVTGFVHGVPENLGTLLLAGLVWCVGLGASAYLVWGLLVRRLTIEGG